MNNILKKALIGTAFSIIVFSSIPFTPINEVYATNPASETIMPRADEFEWRYKIVNNVLYKRLYNRTKNKWVGNWIKC